VTDLNTRFNLPKIEIVQGRRSVVLQKCAGKRVLHLGCVDAGLLAERFARGELMHQQLASVAAELWGVDVDQPGISFLRAKGFDHLLCSDISSAAHSIMLAEEQFDVIVATEVVEHLDNPGLFLKAVKRIMVAGKTEFVVTVPNAFCINNFINLLRGLEVVHPDHNYWFSYQTLGALLSKSGFNITSAYCYTFQNGPFAKSLNGNGSTTKEGARSREGFSTALRRRAKSALCSALYGRSSFWGEGLIAVCQIRAQREESDS